MQVKLNKAITAERGHIFAKGSIVEFMTKVSNAGIVQIMPVDAVDEQGLPYVSAGMNTVYQMELTPQDYTKLDKDVELKKMSFNYPNSHIDDKDDDDTVTASLIDLYDEKPYVLTPDGDVKKKAGMETKEEEAKEEHEKSETKEEEAKEEHKEASKKTASEDNMLVDSNENITTDFDPAVGGSDNPIDDGVRNDIANEDTKEKPATELFSNPLTSGIKKLEDLKETLAKEENNLNDGDTSIDYDPAIDGSGTIDKGTYSADEAEKKWKDENLGNVQGK